MADGIYLNQVSNYGPKAKEFLNSFDFANSYSKVTGEEATTKLAPLSHDVISELYFLGSFNPNSDNDRVRFNNLLQVAIEIEGGSGLVNFFTRAANDWSHHPTLNLLLPRFGQSLETFSTWLALMSNIIDKIDIPLTDKIDVFGRVTHGVYSESPEVFNSLQHVFEGFFLRVLKEASSTQTLDYWVRDYAIFIGEKSNLPTPESASAAHELIPSIEITEGLTLKPIDYCMNILRAVKKVDPEIRPKLMWQGLFQIYHHGTLHCLSNRELGVRDIEEFLDAYIFELNRQLSVSFIFRDVIAGAIQFGHFNKDRKSCLALVDRIVGFCDSLENKAGFSTVLAAASSAYVSGGLPYEKRKELLNVWNRNYSDNMHSDEAIGVSFVGFAVQLMSGFKSTDDHRIALQQLGYAEKITKRFSNTSNIENFSLCIGEIAKNSGGYLTKEEALFYLKKSTEFAVKHCLAIPKLGSRALQEVSRKYSNSINSAELDSEMYFEMAIDICRRLADLDLDGERLYAGGVLDTKMQHGIQNNDFQSLAQIGDVISELESMGS